MLIKRDTFVCMMLISLGIITIMICIGCGARRHTSKQVEVSKDSVRIEVRERTEWRRDTVYVEVPKQTAQSVLKDSTSRLETDWAISEAHVSSDGILSHRLETKSGTRGIETSVPTKIRDSVVYRDREIVKTNIQEVARPLTPWQKKQIAGFWILVSVGATFALWKARRIWIPLIRRLI